jgi:hypothetical protein
MNTQKLLFGTVAGTVFMFLIDWLVYGYLLKGSMTIVPGYHREMPDMMWLVIGMFLFSAAFTLIYSKGVSAGTKVQQGMRFGVLVGVLVGLGLNLIWYSLQMADPLTDFLIDGAYTIVKLSLMGIVVAYATGTPGGDGNRGKSEGGGQ